MTVAVPPVTVMGSITVAHRARMKTEPNISHAETAVRLVSVQLQLNVYVRQNLATILRVTIALVFAAVTWNEIIATYVEGMGLLV
jgi:hypothetical protein